jgi:hypothetical protein
MRQLIGIVLLVPQGVVPLGLGLLGSDTRSWFLPQHLPEELRLPVSVAFIAIGGLITLLTRDPAHEV